MLGTIIKWIILLALLAVIGYVVLMVLQCQGTLGPNQPDIPKVDEAAYSVQIKNTGNLLFTDDYELVGSEVGKRVFILDGFWEMRGQNFKYNAGEIVLDEGIFGEITVKRR